EMAAAYAILTNGGIYNTPHVIARIDDRDGKALYQHRSQGRRVLEEEAAYIMAHTLQDYVRYGLGQELAGIAEQLGAYGGVSDDLHNSWHAGVAPNLVTSVWIGAERGRTRLGATEAAARDISGAVLADLSRRVDRS